MTFDQLEYFLCIAEHKSFSRAAEALYVSQSSLSKQIMSLENELGKILFIRNNTRIELTSFGKLFLEFAQRTFVEYQTFLNHLPCPGDESRKLRLGVLPVLFEYNLMDAISKFQMTYEHVRLMLYEGGQKTLMETLDNRQQDAAIAYSDFISPHKYEFVPVNYDSLSIMCSKNHHLASVECIFLEQIKNESIIILEDNASVIYQMLYNVCREMGFALNITLTSNRHEHLLRMLCNNAGVIAILPSMLANYVSKADIMVIPLKEKISTTISLIWLREHKENPCLDEFIKYWCSEIKAIR